MNRTRFVHTAPLDTLATVLVACSFFSIWLLWPPSKASHQAGARVSPETRYVFRSTPVDNRRSPMDLVRPLSGSGEIEQEDFDIDVVAPSRSDLARLLDRPCSAVRIPPGLDLKDDTVERRIRAYVDTPVFTSIPPVKPQPVRVSVSSVLCAREFNTPVLSAASFSRLEQPWILKAFVEVDEHGSVSQVLLETPTADAELNAAVLRALYGSHAGRSDQPTDGIVAISGRGTKPE